MGWGWGGGGGGDGKGKKEEKEKPCWCLNFQPLVLNLHFWLLFICVPDSHSKQYEGMWYSPKMFM